MINEEMFEAFNNRMVANLTNIKTMSPAQLDRVKTMGSAAENLLKNKDFVLFIRQFQLETLDAQVNVIGHSTDSNQERIALSNQLNGIDNFISLLKKQVYLKNNVVTQQAKSQEPTA